MATRGLAFLSAPGSGIDLNNACVYGCCILLNTSRIEPVSTASPEYITQILSQVSNTKPRLWDINSIEVPYFFPKSFTRSTTAASTVTSRAVVGSSKIKSEGFDINAIAITIRCC